MAQLDQLDIFQGEATHQLARVYARVPRGQQDESATLGGMVIGPESMWATTLPARFPLRDLGPGPTLLAGARITDPCFWSPRSPALYRARVELADGQQTREATERQFHLRQFGTYKKDFRWEGKRWVLRGVHVARGESVDWQQCRDWATALVLDQPPDDVCCTASEQGVVVVAYVDGDEGEVGGHLRRLARWAAVLLVIVGSGSMPENSAVGDRFRGVAPNILLGQMIEPGDSAALPAWADVVLCDASQGRAAIDRQAALLSVPVIAVRRTRGDDPLPQRRAACDRLQRDLASGQNYAGYIV